MIFKAARVGIPITVSLRGPALLRGIHSLQNRGYPGSHNAGQRADGLHTSGENCI
jgi:hypothetical protein